MLNGKFVIDCVVHGFDNRLENIRDARYGTPLLEGNFEFHTAAAPDPYRLNRSRFFQKMTPDALASALFAESATDVAFYHPIPMPGIFHDFSPVSTGLEIRRTYPGRMFVYGAVSPLDGPRAIDDLSRQVAEWDISGLKLYPVDAESGRLRSWRMSDESVAYPIFEACQKLGVKNVAIHKAIPLGTAPMDAFLPNDVDYAARDFPDLNFQIVHGGYAFLQETAFQIARFPNVYVDLEVTTMLLTTRPRAFARILGELLLYGGRQKVFWSTGCTSVHPDPVLRAFEQFQFPPDMLEGEGYPPLTDDLKADILAQNFARIHDLDVKQMQAEIEGDDLAVRRQGEPIAPWSLLP